MGGVELRLDVMAGYISIRKIRSCKWGCEVWIYGRLRYDRYDQDLSSICVLQICREAAEPESPLNLRESRLNVQTHSGSTNVSSRSRAWSPVPGREVSRSAQIRFMLLVPLYRPPHESVVRRGNFAVETARPVCHCITQITAKLLPIPVIRGTEC